MPAEGALRVRGLADLHRALALADKETRLAVRKVELETAEPVRSAAEQLALSEIRGMERAASRGGFPPWAHMRIGITRKVVYIAPKQRGHKKGPQKRRNLAPLLMDRAMQPALERNRHAFEAGFERALDRIANHFNHGGP